jgi:hypothetical protein
MTAGSMTAGFHNLGSMTADSMTSGPRAQNLKGRPGRRKH